MRNDYTGGRGRCDDNYSRLSSYRVGGTSWSSDQFTSKKSQPLNDFTRVLSRSPLSRRKMFSLPLRSREVHQGCYSSQHPNSRGGSGLEARIGFSERCCVLLQRLPLSMSLSELLQLGRRFARVGMLTFACMGSDGLGELEYSAVEDMNDAICGLNGLLLE